jgi:ADP-ribose pyrophosphatase YjhB (NUDIX family)
MEKRKNSYTDTNYLNMFCNNCGESGHQFKTCKEPTISCGLIILNTSTLPSKDPKLLMIRRKDSLSFLEFMRGKYSIDDKEYIGKLLSNMTHKEIDILRTKPFDVIWNSLWSEQTADYVRSKDLFALLDLEKLLMEYSSPYSDQEWGFPKGRRMRGETVVDCATREFFEETNIVRASYIVLKNIILEETFEGLNGKMYKHIYYVCILNPANRINLERKLTNLQLREVSAVAWKTLEECQNLIRPQHTQRKQLLEELKNIISTYEVF